MKKYFCRLIILLTAISIFSAQAQTNYLLDSTTNKRQSIITQAEVELGEHWLRTFRSHVKTTNNSLLHSYIEQLLNNLVQHSGENLGDLKLVIVKNSTLNAFAVPGGVIGIHTGIFNYAQNEDQLASILAHEIAHLSKRHIFRAQQSAKQHALPMYAALIASIALASAGESDASMAAISASQAAAAHTQLRFSRAHETEADIEGLEILKKAGYAPQEMANMLTLLRKTAGASSQSLPPEYLLTHPLPNTRITEVRQRILQSSVKSKHPSITFALMKNLILAQSQSTHIEAIKLFKNHLSNKRTDALEFGLANAYINANQLALALPIMRRLYKKQPKEIAYIYTLAQALTGNEQYQHAQTLLEKHLKTAPENYALNMALINTLTKKGALNQAQQALFKLSNQRPNDPLIWHMLSETSGKKQDLIQAHQARAEYYMLHNAFEKSTQQLEYALKIKPISRAQSLTINNRLSWIKETKERQQQLGF